MRNKHTNKISAWKSHDVILLGAWKARSLAAQVHSLETTISVYKCHGSTNIFPDGPDPTAAQNEYVTESPNPDNTRPLHQRNVELESCGSLRCHSNAVVILLKSVNEEVGTVYKQLKEYEQQP